MRIADAVEEGKTVAVRGVVIRVLTSSVAVVVEGVVKLESGFKLACYGLVASDAELPADLVECVGFGFVWWQVVELAELVGLRFGDMLE